GVSGSGGMIRSAMASIAWPSGPVKKTHGPGLTGMGGLPAFGAHGSPPATTAARLDKPPSRKTAVLANKFLRLKLMTNTNRLTFLEVWTIHGVSQKFLASRLSSFESRQSEVRHLALVTTLLQIG